ncbi:chemotaxis protein CheW [Mucilaginibacter sp. Bleaf8]|uniref:chemotaxis protein CheW n=1 Tax=Mucilaginibacter sp. Bleaf8 TaxID=2834430 RepID=UPI001BCD5587|nr:chemotaxis protein CheW [Mucilaginibacter sp. Bleaf8]MBS7566789.1 chemotaxis protein CheW [Mucilaginibacter sp. Bleaf8]
MSANTEIHAYLTFRLEQELFAFNVGQVLEILEMKPITKIPGAPDFMRGVINLRGNVLPVIDTRIKFRMQETDFTIDTCIIVLTTQTENGPVQVGAIVDAVQKVIDLTPDQIQPPVSMGASYREDYVSGIAKADEDFILTINIDKVFAVDDISALSEN